MPVNLHRNSMSLELASFGASLRIEALPSEVTEKAKLHILDTLGAAIAGMASAEASACLQTFELQAWDGRAPLVWGTPLQAFDGTSTLINGVAAHAFELDDTDGCDHSGAVVLPAVLGAISHATAPTGADVLTSTVMGYEIARRVLDASGGYVACNARGWHSTGTCGSFGAAAGAASMLRLSPPEYASAIGLAGSFVGGLWAFIDDGAMSKRLHAGRAAANGLTSAMLAEKAFTGPSKVFEAEWGGYFATYVPGGGDPETLTLGLGDSWRLMQASIKPYASCRGTHTAIDVVLALARAEDLAPEQIASIHVRTSEFLFQMCGGEQISSMVDAQMSLPYCIAAALVFNQLGLAEMNETARGNRIVRGLLERLSIDIEPTFEAHDEPEIRLRLTDGRELTVRGSDPLGSPSNPLSENQVIGKFNDLVETVFPPGRPQQIVDTVMQLDQLEDARKLLEVLRSDKLPHISRRG